VNCSFFQPQLIFVNIKLDPHPEAQPEPKILSAFGLTTNEVNLSARMGGRYRGKFMGDLLFQKFPYDTQKLVASMRAPVDMPYHKLQFVSKAQMTDNPQYLRKMRSAGGRWQVTKVWAEDTLRETQEGIGSTFNLTRRAQIELCIEVTRETGFFLLNHILAISMLVGLSFMTFVIDPSSIEGRLSISLSVVVGLSVFQIVVLDAMPTTGYLTHMHEFTIVSTIFVVFVCVQNVVMHLARKRATRLKALFEWLKHFFNNTKAKKGVVVVQKVVAGHLARKRLAKLRSASYRMACSMRLEHERRRLKNWYNRMLDRGALFCDAQLDRLSIIGFPATFALLTYYVFQEGILARF